MTERKPANVSFETWVEAQIREARERGEFDNLPGHGKPLANIDGHDDDMWWVKQWLKRENVSFTPPALALRKSVEDMLESVGRLRSEKAVRDVVGELNDRIRHMNRIPPIDGPPSNLMPLDVDRVLERWAEQRPAFAAAEAAVLAELRPAAPVNPRRAAAGLSQRAQAIAMLFVTICEVGALELLFPHSVIARAVGVLSLVLIVAMLVKAWRPQRATSSIQE